MLYCHLYYYQVLVVGNPANTNALICSHYAPTIPKQNFSAMTRLDQNRASAQLAAKLGQPITAIKKVTIWGNHSSTQFPDASQAVVNGAPVSVDQTWLETEFVPTVQKRGAAVIAARKLSSAMSAAKVKMTTHYPCPGLSINDVITCLRNFHPVTN